MYLAHDHHKADKQNRPALPYHLTTIQNKQDDIYKDETKNTTGLISKSTRDDFKYIKNPQETTKAEPKPHSNGFGPCNI